MRRNEGVKGIFLRSFMKIKSHKAIHQGCLLMAKGYWGGGGDTHTLFCDGDPNLVCYGLTVRSIKLDLMYRLFIDSFCCWYGEILLTIVWRPFL